MKANEILNNVMVALGMESAAPTQTNFEQRKQAEGEAVFEAESFEVGNAVFVVGEEDERMPVPEGEYMLEEAVKMVVDAQGVITAIGEAEGEEEKEEEPKAEAAPAEEEVEAATESPSAPRKVIESQVRETIFSEVKVELEKITSAHEAEKAEWDTARIEMSKEIDALKERLAEEPAAQPLSHNVEGKAPTKQVFKNSSWKESTQDRVYKRMYNS